MSFHPDPSLITANGKQQLNNHGLLQYICLKTEWSATASHVAMCLAVHRCAATGQCNPSIETVSSETRLSIGSVRRGIKELITKPSPFAKNNHSSGPSRTTPLPSATSSNICPVLSRMADSPLNSFQRPKMTST